MEDKYLDLTYKDLNDLLTIWSDQLFHQCDVMYVQMKSILDKRTTEKDAATHEIMVANCFATLDESTCYQNVVKASNKIAKQLQKDKEENLQKKLLELVTQKNNILHALLALQQQEENRSYREKKMLNRAQNFVDKWGAGSGFIDTYGKITYDDYDLYESDAVKDVEVRTFGGKEEEPLQLKF